jgi:hypothetical protein
MMSNKKLTSLAVVVLTCCFYTVSGQTLSNLTVAQKRRNEANVDKFAVPLKTTQLNTFKAPALAGGGGADTRPQDELGLWQASARYARDNKVSFARLIEMYSKNQDIVEISRGAAAPLNYLAYAVLASQDQKTIDQYYTDNRIVDGPIKNAIKSEIAAIKQSIAKISGPTIAVFASGNIRNIATNDAPEPTTTGTGTLGATYASSNHVLSVQFTVAATLDTTRSGFGSYLLAPLNGKSLRSALIEWLPKLNWSDRSWLHLYGNFAASTWEVQKDSIYKNVTNMGLGVLYHHRIFEGLLAETEVGLDGEIGLAGRWLAGDIRNMLKQEVTTAKYLATFPTKRSFFTGIEAGFTLNFGQVVGSAQAFYFFPKKDEPIDGLTGFQLSVGLSVRGDIIRGALSGKD